MKAKQASLIGKWLSVAIMIVGMILKGVGVLHDVTVWDVCTVALCIAGIFGTIDLNIALDKFTALKQNNTAMQVIDKAEQVIGGQDAVCKTQRTDC